MKKKSILMLQLLILLVSLSYSNSIYACKNFSSINFMWGVSENNEYKVLSSQKISLTEDEHKSQQLPKHFDYNTCKNTYQRIEVQLKKSDKSKGKDSVYVLVVTAQDECDGGNTYGTLYNYAGDTVGTMADLSVTCN